MYFLKIPVIFLTLFVLVKSINLLLPIIINYQIYTSCCTIAISLISLIWLDIGKIFNSSSMTNEFLQFPKDNINLSLNLGSTFYFILKKTIQYVIQF